MSPEFAAVEVVWRETDEGGDLFAADLAEFGQQGEERKSEDWADAWHGDEQAIAMGEPRIGCDQFGQPLTIAASRNGF